MKDKIHPEYVECEVVCGCGERFVTRATTPSIRVEVCSKCHPFYTGKQKLVDSAGRVEKFQRRWGKHIEETKARLSGQPNADEPVATEAEPVEAAPEASEAEPEAAEAAPEVAEAEPEAAEVAPEVAEAETAEPEAEAEKNDE